MLTQGEIKEDVLAQLGASTTMGYYTDAILSRWIDKANKFCAGYKPWPFTEGRASTTMASLVTTEDGDLSLEYFEGWRTDGIRLLQIGGTEVEKLVHGMYRDELEDRPTAVTPIFSDFGRRIYVSGNTGLSGSVVAWGQVTPLTIDPTDPNAPTIFTGEEDGNEAIVEEVLRYAARREKKWGVAKEHHDTAKDLLNDIWDRIAGNQHRYGTRNKSMFKHFNVVDQRTSSGQPFNEDQF